MPGLSEVYPERRLYRSTGSWSREDLRLIPDNGTVLRVHDPHWPELAAATPTRHWVANIELGLDYAVVVTSCAGLWAYVMGDTVKFVEHKPSRLLVTGRTSYTLSSFGEHLTGGEIDDAVGAGSICHRRTKSSILRSAPFSQSRETIAVGTFSSSSKFQHPLTQPRGCTAFCSNPRRCPVAPQ